MPKINIEGVESAVQLVGIVFPQLMAAYNVLKSIWMTANPGKTEDEYVAYLRTISTQVIDESDAVLVSLGYVKDADGKWSKPSPT